MLSKKRRLEDAQLSQDDEAEITREYDDYLAPFQPGHYGEIILADGESKQMVRNRLQAAAKRRALVVNFKRTQGPMLWFRISAEGDPHGRFNESEVFTDDEYKAVRLVI